MIHEYWMDKYSEREELPPRCCKCKQIFKEGETIWDDNGNEWCPDCSFEATTKGEFDD